MKRYLALFLQVTVVLAGSGVLAFLLLEPHIEGRNAQATAFEIYFKDPFLAYVYVASIPFFFALYRAFGLLGHFGRHGAFTQVTVDALRTIGRCAFAIIGFVAGGVVLMFVLGDPEPPGVVMSVLVALVSGLIAIAATLSARALQKALRQPEGSRG
jgi:hypothetical protein